MAHGQRSLAAPGLRRLGQLPRARGSWSIPSSSRTAGSGAFPATSPTCSTSGRRPSWRGAQPAVCALPRPQGGAPGPRPAAGRHLRPGQPRGLRDAPSATATSTGMATFRRARTSARSRKFSGLKPAFAEPFALRQSEPAQRLLRSIHAGTQEEIRARAAMMASVDEGVGMLLEALEATGTARRDADPLPRRQRVLLRRARARAGAPLRLRGGHPLAVRRPPSPARSRRARWSSDLVLALDIAPTAIELAGGTPGPRAGALAPAAAGGAPAGLADVVPHRVLRRERHAVAGRHDLQGRPHRAPQADPLGAPGLASTSCTISSAIRTS